MSTSIKEGVIDIAADRKNLNTPIDVELFNQFKSECASYGLTMNVVIEGLMKDFCNNNYAITITKTGVSLKRED